jgi:hypothetical protein
MSAPLHPRTQKTDLRAWRTHQDGLVLIEPRVNEPEYRGRELIRAGVQDCGMSGLLRASLR